MQGQNNRTKLDISAILPRLLSGAVAMSPHEILVAEQALFSILSPELVALSCHCLLST